MNLPSSPPASRPRLGPFGHRRPAAFSWLRTPSDLTNRRKADARGRSSDTTLRAWIVGNRCGEERLPAFEPDRHESYHLGGADRH